MDGIETHEQAPRNLDAVWPQFKPDSEWVALPELPLLDEGVICENRDGKGSYPKQQSMMIGNRKMDVPYLRLISALPNAQVGRDGKKGDVMSFRFDGAKDC